MKQSSKKLFSLVVLCSTATVMADSDGRVSPFLQWRSQGRDTARKLYGTTSWAVYQDRDREDGCYGTFNVTVQYDQTFRGKEIAECLFGNSLVNNPNVATTTTNNCKSDCDDKVILIQGSQVANKAATSWMAENFYLPRNFNGFLTFSPKVTNILADFNLYVGLDRWVSGLYFRLYGPVVRNKSGLHVTETIITPGSSPVGDYLAGFFDPVTPVPAANLFQSSLSYFGGCQLPAYPGKQENLVTQPLKFAKLTNCNLPATTTNNCDNDCGSSHKKTGFAELRGEFGWNYIRDKYRFLINIQAAAPTGTRPNAEFALEPQVGNGKHWELGIGLGGAWRMWQSEDEEKSFNFIVEADVTHLFRAKQTRTFDLIYNGVAKPNSRYMLAEKLGTNGAQGTEPLDGPGNAGFQFANEYAPVANISTQNVKVSIGAQGDVVAMFNYTVRGFSWDLGYNFWGMSKSKISCPDDCPEECGVVKFAEKTWVLKGDSSVSGVFAGTTTVVNIAASESGATIFNGTFTGTGPNTFNANIDGPQPATGISGGTPLSIINDASDTAQIFTSNPITFISASNLDLDGGETRGLSHKVFTHFSYTWTRNERWLPYLGAGFSAQFGSHSGHDDCPKTTTTTNNCDSSSVSCALSNWAVFVKGGISFQ